MSSSLAPCAGTSWLLAAVVAVLAVVLAHGSPCHDTVAILTGDAVCSTTATGLDESTAAAAAASDVTDAVALGWFESAVAQPGTGSPADVLGLCVAMLMAFLAAFLALAQPSAGRVAELPIAPARILNTPIRPAAPGPVMLCISRT